MWLVITTENWLLCLRNPVLVWFFTIIKTCALWTESHTKSETCVRVLDRIHTHKRMYRRPLSVLMAVFDSRVRPPAKMRISPLGWKQGHTRLAARVNRTRPVSLQEAVDGGGGKKEVKHTQEVQELALQDAVRSDACAVNLFTFSSITGDVAVSEHQFNRCASRGGGDTFDFCPRAKQARLFQCAADFFLKSSSHSTSVFCRFTELRLNLCCVEESCQNTRRLPHLQHHWSAAGLNTVRSCFALQTEGFHRRGGGAVPHGAHGAALPVLRLHLP